MGKKNAIFFLFQGVNFAVQKRQFLDFFWKLSKQAILIGKFLHENSAYRKNGVHRDKGNKKCKKKLPSQIFLLLNLSQRDFLI